MLKQGVLYWSQVSHDLLVVPEEARKLVLSLGHDIPWAGHLGRRKTRARRPGLEDQGSGSTYFGPE